MILDLFFIISGCSAKGGDQVWIIICYNDEAALISMLLMMWID